MDPKEEHKHLKETRDICLASAESFLSVAERELGKNGTNPICFHLALLGLEEIGKSILATISYTTTTGGSEKPGLENASDDHRKKIFWAIWGGNMLREGRFTKESIEESRRLADTLHERRLETLYTDSKNPLPVDERVEDDEVKTLVGLARARLEIEKTQGLSDFEEGDVEMLKWFFDAVEDTEKKKHIFSGSSIKKLSEVENGKEWIKWLYEAFRKNEEEMRKLAEREVSRNEPEREEREKPKYQMRIRIQTPSHSIRGNAFLKWNEGVHNIKIYRTDRKDAKKLTKGEILIDFTFPKSVPPHALWEHGLFMSKTVVIGLNIATLGVFWWHVNKDISTYYEYIHDLEADPKGGVGFIVAPHKRLHVGFDEARLVLDENSMRNVYHIVALFFRESKKLEGFLKAYAMGLTCFSKTDVHLRLEVNAFEEFYNALRSAMLSFGDWDGKSNFKDAVMKQYEKIGDMKDLENTLKLGEALEVDAARKKHHPITLTEVIGMKIYCDYYMQLKAREYFQNLRDDGKKDKSVDQPI